MTSDRHALVRAIFLEAISMPENERNAFLDQRCNEDDGLRNEVKQLLAHHTAEPSPSAAVAAVPDQLEPPIELVAGDVIAGRYRIHGKLGEGATGVVYRADDMVLNQPVAIKFLRTKLRLHAAMLERFRREVRMALRVSHPNVCRVFDIGESEGRTFFTMEFCGGEDLSHLIRRAGRLSPEKGIGIARQTCSGLAAAHSAGVLHRDLKPGNILLDSKGRVLITDFGIAAAVDAAGFREIVGTPGYMAPEQIIGIGVDERSDIYSLGLVMYELFSGRPAYEGKSVKEFLTSQLECEPPSLSEVVPGMDSDIESLVERCISRDRDHRPSSALAVAAALPGVDALSVAIEANQTAPPSLVGDSSNLARRIARPLAWGLLAVVGCFLLPVVRSWSHFPWDDPAAKPPAVLLDRARSLSRALHDTEPFAYSAHGYCDQHRAKLALEQIGGDFPIHYRLGRPGGLIFWYREATEALSPTTTDTLIFGPGHTTSIDPPYLNKPQRVVLLDTRGQLIAMADVALGSSANVARPQRDSLLREAADVESVSTDAPAISWTHSDLGRACEAMGVRLVGGSAATLLDCSFRGFSRIFAILGESSVVAGSPFDLSASKRGVIATHLLRFLYIVATLFAVPLAIRNVRLSRCDLLGANRLCWVLLIASLVGWALRASFGGSPATSISLVAVAMLRGLGIVAMVLTFYLALEPLARKHCPHLMILWTRLLQARPISPVLYDHLLVGVTGGVVLSLVLAVDFAAVHLIGRVTPESVIVKQVGQKLSGLGSLLSGVLHSAQSAVAQGLLLLLILTASRLVLRRNSLAVAATAMILFVLVIPRCADLVISPALIGLFGVGLITWVMIRYGLVSLVVGLFVFDVLNSTPMTWRPSDWFFPVSASVLGVVVALCAIFLMQVRHDRRIAAPAIPSL